MRSSEVSPRGSDPWIIPQGPQCLDSLAACSSVAPEERSSFTLWAHGNNWLHQDHQSYIKPQEHQTAVLEHVQRARRRAWTCVFIVVLGIIGVAIYAVYSALNPSNENSKPVPTTTFSPIPSITISPTPSAPDPPTLLHERGALVFVNKCRNVTKVYFTRNLNNSVAEVSNRLLNSSNLAMVVSGKSWGDFLDANFRLGESTDATNFAVNRADNQVFYSISTRDGFNVPIEVMPMHGTMGCPTIRCTLKNCESNMTIVQACPWIEPLLITFCP